MERRSFVIPAAASIPIDYSPGSNCRRERSRRLGNTIRLAFASTSPTRAQTRLEEWLSAAIRSVSQSTATSPWPPGKATRGRSDGQSWGDGLPACCGFVNWRPTPQWFCKNQRGAMRKYSCSALSRSFRNSVMQFPHCCGYCDVKMMSASGP